MTDLDERYVAITPEAGARLAAAIKARLDAEPGFTQAELVRRSGVSHPTVRNLMRGEPGRRGRTAVALVAVALGWTPDSIDRILDGLEPVGEVGAVNPLQSEGLAELREEVASLRSDLARLTALVLRLPGIDPDELPPPSTTR